MNQWVLFGAGIILALCVGYFLFAPQAKDPVLEKAINALAGETKTAILAGGCFWCVEADFEKLQGVIDVVSGYSGGASEGPTYADYAADRHREAVLVTYDPARVSFEGLVEYLIKHSDPTDAEGSFYDRGVEYAPAVYYKTAEERRAAERVIARIDAMHVYERPLALALLPRAPFFPAEEYHQDYYRKNALKYGYYRNASGRDAFIEKHWGEDTLPSAPPASSYASFVKPSAQELREILTPEQYRITQENGTERAFDNEYWNNKEEGIYVDVVSGEPLFSSRDKFDSGTGWPSFTKPVESAHIVFGEDRSLFGVRTEVRSRYADSHLGHVFEDAPPELGGIRYCMNSAALRFVPLADLAKEGYGEYAILFE